MSKKQAVVTIGFVLIAVAAVGVYLDTERIAPWQPDKGTADACYALQNEEWGTLDDLADEVGEPDVASAMGYLAFQMLRSDAPGGQPLENVLTMHREMLEDVWDDCADELGDDDMGAVGGRGYDQVAGAVEAHTRSLEGSAG